MAEEPQAAYDVTADKPTEPADPPQYTVQVRIAFLADGQQIAGLGGEAAFAVPAEGDTQLITIPIDARTFAEGFIPQLLALATADAEKAARANVGKPVAVEGPGLLLANGQPAPQSPQPNRATRRGHLTRVRD